MNTYWFHQKTFGYGATPATWEGWLVTVGFIGIVIALWRLWLANGRFSQRKFGLYLGLVGVLTAGFLWLSWIKTEGGWGGRWGDRGEGRSGATRPSTDGFRLG
jgi:hypothetical protein